MKNKQKITFSRAAQRVTPSFKIIVIESVEQRKGSLTLPRLLAELLDSNSNYPLYILRSILFLSPQGWWGEAEQGALCCSIQPSTELEYHSEPSLSKTLPVPQHPFQTIQHKKRRTEGHTIPLTSFGAIHTAPRAAVAGPASPALAVRGEKPVSYKNTYKFLQ